MKKENYIVGITLGLALVFGGIALSTSPAFAQSNTAPQGNWGQNMPQGGWQQHGPQQGGQMGPMRAPGVAGLVTGINGTTLTVASRMPIRNPMNGGSVTQGSTATTTYSVDASNATVIKNNATSTVSSISVNDRVFVQGTVSGTNVTATKIIDGLVPGMMGRGHGMPGMRTGTSTSPFAGVQGNGEPVVVGTVSNLNGSTFTVTNNGSTAYTVDASSATVTKGNTTSSVSNIANGDHVIVQGTVNGSSITASTVIDSSASTSTSKPGGFFGMIGQFFQHLFGF